MFAQWALESSSEMDAVPMLLQLVRSGKVSAAVITDMGSDYVVDMIPELREKWNMQR